MTKKTRTIIFLICFFLFIIIAPAIVLYAQGYRFNFEKKSFTRTGGLFLKIEPKQAEIYIDDKLVKKTDFFFGSALIENLLPKKYTVMVKKDGYFDWKKKLEIKEKEVTEVKYIILIPISVKINVLAEDVEKFWFNDDGKKIILYKKNGSESEGWSLKLYDLEKNVKSHLINEKDISPEGADFLGASWSRDSEKIYINTAMNPSPPQAAGYPVTNGTSSFGGGNTPPLGAGMKAAETKKKERRFSLKTKGTPGAFIEVMNDSVPENIITYIKSGDMFYYLDDSGSVYKTSSSPLSDYSAAISDRELINNSPFPVKKETKYELNVFPGYLFLKENGAFYLYNPKSKSFEYFFEGLNVMKISPDGKKIVFFSKAEIWVLFLENKTSQPIKKAGDKIFLLRLSEKIKNVFWLDSDYLIFNTEEKIYVSEIDERDKANIFELAAFHDPEIFFNFFDKKLYIKVKNNIYVSGIVIP